MSLTPPEILFVEPEEAGLRIDKLLSLRFKDQSRTYFQYLISEGLIFLNSQPVKKRICPHQGDEIEIHFALTPELQINPEAIPLDILYEDEWVIAINKPASMVVHPAPGNWTGTFVNALLAHCGQLPNSDNILRPGIVHRLDKETSGVLLAAKTVQSHRLLVDAFAQRKIHKEYIAICIGHPKLSSIDLPIGRDPKRRQQMAINHLNGKAAKTHCYPLLSIGNYSLVQLLLETGRTHQIRVHLQSLGTPILGDSVYGSSNINQKEMATRQLLHAHRVSFSHPITQKQLHLEAPIPADLGSFIRRGEESAFSIPKRFGLTP